MILIRRCKIFLLFSVLIGTTVASAANLESDQVEIDATIASVADPESNQIDRITLPVKNIDLRPPLPNSDNLDLEVIKLFVEPYKNIVNDINTERGCEIVRILDYPEEELLRFYYHIQDLSLDEFELEVKSFIDKVESIKELESVEEIID